MLVTEKYASSALQRSKTAPTPLVDLPRISAAQWSGFPNTRVGRINRSNVSGIKTKPHARKNAKIGDVSSLGAATRGLDLALDGALASPTHMRPPLVSPRHDIRDDPFSLAGFFPSRPGSPEHPVEWAWRSSVEEPVPEAEEESEETQDTGAGAWRSLPSVRSMSMNALDDYAREVIAKESKLGILGLARVPSFLKSISESYFGQAEEDQQAYAQSYSAAIDEPFDAETLCESMQSRRVSSEREIAIPERVPSLGLFGPAREADEAEGSWASALYTKILGPEV